MEVEASKITTARFQPDRPQKKASDAGTCIRRSLCVREYVELLEKLLSHGSEVLLRSTLLLLPLSIIVESQRFFRASSRPFKGTDG